MESRERRVGESALTRPDNTSVLKSRDKAYYWNLLCLTLTVAIEDVHEVGARSTAELFELKCLAYDAIIAEDDSQLGAETDAEYVTELVGQLIEMQMRGAFDEG